MKMGCIGVPVAKVDGPGACAFVVRGETDGIYIIMPDGDTHKAGEIINSNSIAIEEASDETQ